MPGDQRQGEARVPICLSSGGTLLPAGSLTKAMAIRQVGSRGRVAAELLEQRRGSHREDKRQVRSDQVQAVVLPSGLPLPLQTDSKTFSRGWDFSPTVPGARPVGHSTGLGRFSQSPHGHYFILGSAAEGALRERWACCWFPAISLVPRIVLGA